MILLTRQDDSEEVGINPDHIIATDPNEGGSSVHMVEHLVFGVVETPRQIETAISRHHSKYTNG